MKNFIAVNKLLGENVDNITRRECREHDKRPKDWNYQIIRKQFCDNLKSKGYSKIVNVGNYIIASNDKETVTFYFAAHNPCNHNYLVSTVLENEVNYYAFYDNSNNSVYLVGYGIVRKYCKSLKESYTFYNDVRHIKLFIPDDWARQQRINTYSL